MIVEKQVPVTELRKGMYVSRLDRPWTETPFLFQGFHITRARELEILQDYCQHVFVDFDRTREIEHETAEPNEPDLIAPLPKPVEHYPDECTAQAEMDTAQRAMAQVAETVQQVMDNLRQGKSVNM